MLELYSSILGGERQCWASNPVEMLTFATGNLMLPSPAQVWRFLLHTICNFGKSFFFSPPSQLCFRGQSYLPTGRKVLGTHLAIASSSTCVPSDWALHTCIPTSGPAPIALVTLLAFLSKLLELVAQFQVKTGSSGSIG